MEGEHMAVPHCKVCHLGFVVEYSAPINSLGAMKMVPVILELSHHMSPVRLSAGRLIFPPQPQQDRG